MFEAIREARPPRLYVAADGPRPGHPGERARVKAVRDYVTANVDWQCEVKTLFRAQHLGLRRAVSEAIDWFFEHEEEGVILEDDCLPDPSFFGFCDELLDRYRDDDRVMHISGGCHVGEAAIREAGVDGSYFLSRYPHIWGWATWRDVWRQYSTDPRGFEADFQEISRDFASRREAAHWRRIFRGLHAGKFESWSYHWILSVWRGRGVSIYPTRNLVRNIGFGSRAVHTKPWKDYKGLRKPQLESMDEIRHPRQPALHPELDLEDFRAYFERPHFAIRLYKVVKRTVGWALGPVRKALCPDLRREAERSRT